MSAAGGGTAARPLHGVAVLIVEDDPDGRDLIAEALMGAGARVERAESAAVAFARFLAEPPHVLVSDIGMPDEDGYSLLRRIRALPPEKGGDVPAVALTAFARPRTRAAPRTRASSSTSRSRPRRIASSPRWSRWRRPRRAETPRTGPATS